MKSFWLLVLLIAGLAGCASAPSSQYGNFLDHAAVTDDQAMASDVVAKLTKLYPPANTAFTMQHATADAFGASLVSSMRAKGYAIREFKLKASEQEPAATSPAMTKRSGDIPFSYVLDQPASSDLYRITLFINNQTLSRLYQAKNGAIAPAGYWVRKE